MWPGVVTDGPHIMKPKVGPVCHGRMQSGIWPILCRTHVRPSLAYRQKLISSLKMTECHSALQSTLSRHQSSHVWRCHGVSGSQVRGTCDLSPAASRRFPLVPGNTVGATCTWISSLNAVWAATAARKMHQSWCVSVLRGRPESGLRIWECSTDYCWKQRHTTDTFCPKCVTIRRYVHQASHRPTMRPR